MGVADSGTLHHTCWVVNDLDAVARQMAESLSVSWSVWTIEPEVCTVHGRTEPVSFKVALTTIGDSGLELLQPLTGNSVYVEHLATKGEGFHHTCIFYETHDAMRSAKDELTAQGREMIQHGDLGELGEFCYFAFPETDSVLELLYLSELPPPDETIG